MSNTANPNFKEQLLLAVREGVVEVGGTGQDGLMVWTEREELIVHCSEEVAEKLYDLFDAEDYAAAAEIIQECEVSD